MQTMSINANNKMFIYCNMKPFHAAVQECEERLTEQIINNT